MRATARAAHCRQTATGPRRIPPVPVLMPPPAPVESPPPAPLFWFRFHIVFSYAVMRSARPVSRIRFATLRGVSDTSAEIVKMINAGLVEEGVISDAVNPTRTSMRPKWACTFVTMSSTRADSVMCVPDASPLPRSASRDYSQSRPASLAGRKFHRYRDCAEPIHGYTNATEVAQGALVTGRSVAEIVIERRLLPGRNSKTFSSRRC